MWNKAGGSGRAARAMALPHFELSDHVALNVLRNDIGSVTITFNLQDIKKISMFN